MGTHPPKLSQHKTEIILTGATALVTVFAIVIGKGLVSDWGVTQWGPVSAWVAGALTLGAVSVSLWQAHEAGRRADEEVAKAEQRLEEERTRHANETAAAEKRHKEQLVQAQLQLRRQEEAASRANQLTAIRQINEKLTELLQRCDDFGPTLFRRAPSPGDAEIQRRRSDFKLRSHTAINSSYLLSSDIFHPDLDTLAEDLLTKVSTIADIVERAEQGSLNPTEYFDYHRRAQKSLWALLDRTAMLYRGDPSKHDVSD